MAENPTSVSMRAASSSRKSVYSVEEASPIECSGKLCRSCTAGVVADCVAICCCPCAIVNLLAFAFLKIPWKVGKKYLQSVKNRKKNNLKTLENHRSFHGSQDPEGQVSVVFAQNLPIEDVALQDKQSESAPAATVQEAERVWFDLYQDGHHLGFGSVSFSALP